MVGAGVLVAALQSPGRAADTPAPNAVLDRAIQALGGEEKLGKVKAASWTVKGTITFNGTDNPFTGRSVVQGLDHFRQEFEGEFGGSAVIGDCTVGANCWLSYGTVVMDENVPANSVVFGRSPALVVKPAQRDVMRERFRHD